ncbi:MAG: hypothetical protein CL959_04905 [Euryarchaeota archaeon]|nr:hypothetical protein [Euryarchaeota archaeon]
MALRGIKSKEEEDPYMQPLAGVKTVDISGGQVTPVLGDKASLLKSAKTPSAPVATAPVGQNQPETAATTTGPLSWNPSMRSEEEVQRGKDIAGKVRGLAKEGKLTADLLKKARDRGVTDSAFDDKGFDAFLKKEGISPSGTLVAESPLATSNLRRQDFASQAGFDAAVARQSGGGAAQPAQPLGSGSALRQAPREIGTRAGKLASAARRARRFGAWGEAQKLMGQSLQERVNQPNIVSEAHRGRVAAQQEQLAGAQSQMEDMQLRRINLANKLLADREKAAGLQTGGLQTGGLQTGGLRTMEKRTSY